MPPRGSNVLGASVNPLLVESAEVTVSIFDLHPSWRISQNSPFKSIQSHVQEYVKVLDLSVAAARVCFKFCDDVITVSELLRSSNEKERQEFLHDMHASAKQGAANAERIYSDFVALGARFEELLLDVRRVNQASTVLVDHGPLDNSELSNAVTTLEGFSASIRSHITNWNRRKMDQKSQETRHGMLIHNYNAIRHEGILETWKNLRQDYVTYTCTVHSVQAKGSNSSDKNKEYQG